MKFRNYELNLLAQLLFQMKLSGKKSRMRTRFILQVETYLKNTLEPELQVLVEEYGLRDIDNELIPSIEGGYELIPEKAEEYHKEYNTILEEYYIVEVNETNRDMIQSIAEALLDCEIELSNDEAVLYDRWCEQFEMAVEKYNKQSHQ